MTKINGTEVMQADPVGEWIRYGDVKLVHAACKAWLLSRGLKSEEWNRRHFVYRKKKRFDKAQTRCVG
jgi:hypothetical protein